MSSSRPPETYLQVGGTSAAMRDSMGLASSSSVSSSVSGSSIDDSSVDSQGAVFKVVVLGDRTSFLLPPRIRVSYVSYYDVRLNATEDEIVCLRVLGIPDKLLDNSELWDQAHAIVLTYNPYEADSLSKVRNDYAPLLEYFAAGLPVILVSFTASEDESEGLQVLTSAGEALANELGYKFLECG
eukprot:CAMPEP_0174230696 /NCGR_PEP_ID=MMETSP0417-20130205/1403_1 /TAXON_ID=242541 /ORGANISM="Mayorella sp, Strain BSH-02190019" /LENGTH=183 /DNA_ID=CAMNT_0015308435 /DNA_START=226 /DNA_END=773 /DNA_ORIENTATION=+